MTLCLWLVFLHLLSGSNLLEVGAVEMATSDPREIGTVTHSKSHQKLEETLSLHILWPEIQVSVGGLQPTAVTDWRMIPHALEKRKSRGDKTGD